MNVQNCRDEAEGRIQFMGCNGPMIFGYMKPASDQLVVFGAAAQRYLIKWN
jgi:hypothetical protein